MSIQIIIDQDEMYAIADEFGLSKLLPQTARQIHQLANRYPGEAKFVINKSLGTHTTFVVIMVATRGLFSDAVILFDWSPANWLNRLLQRSKKLRPISRNRCSKA